MNEMPCTDCICIPICKGIVNKKTFFSAVCGLIDRCSLAKVYIQHDLLPDDFNDAARILRRTNNIERGSEVMKYLKNI
jgi:hypothetical protein